MRTRTLHGIAITALFVMLGAALPAAAQDGGVTIAEISTARGYDHGPTDPATSFATTDGRVYIAMTVGNTTGAEANIRVTFERADSEPRDGVTSGGVELTIPARRSYHTCARCSTSRPAGRWRAVVRDTDGHVIGQVEFDITA